MRGQLLVDADTLVEIRDALVRSDVTEAYHLLRLMCDPECRVYMRTGNHWAEWEAVAEVRKADRAIAPINA